MLLAELEGLTGPWRCLLLTVPSHLRPALESAATAFVQQHLLHTPASEPAHVHAPPIDVATGMERQWQQPGMAAAVLRELLVCLMLLLPQLSREEALLAVRQLCSMAGGPSAQDTADGTTMARLVSELSAAEAGARMEAMRLQPGYCHDSCEPRTPMQTQAHVSCSGDIGVSTRGPAGAFTADAHTLEVSRRDVIGAAPKAPVASELLALGAGLEGGCGGLVATRRRRRHEASTSTLAPPSPPPSTSPCLPGEGEGEGHDECGERDQAHVASDGRGVKRVPRLATMKLQQAAADR